MLRRYSLIGLLPLLLLATPAAALTAKDKMDTCKFGADDQKLTGAKRTAFMSRCMANEKAKPAAAAKKPAANAAAAPPAAGTSAAAAPAAMTPPAKPQ